MKQFVFALQPLYDMQDSNEKKFKLQMAEIEEELGKRKKDLELLNKNFGRVSEDYRNAVSRGVQAQKVKEYGEFFERLKAVIALVQEKIVFIESEKEKCLQKLVQIRKEKKLLDKLRKNKYEEYMDESKKQQDKRVDDLITYKTSV